MAIAVIRPRDGIRKYFVMRYENILRSREMLIISLTSLAGPCTEDLENAYSEDFNTSNREFDLDLVRFLEATEIRSSQPQRS
jgi:hypothetical protein